MKHDRQVMDDDWDAIEMVDPSYDSRGFKDSLKIMRLRQLEGNNPIHEGRICTETGLCPRSGTVCKDKQRSRARFPEEPTTRVMEIPMLTSEEKINLYYSTAEIEQFKRDQYFNKGIFVEIFIPRFVRTSFATVSLIMMTLPYLAFKSMVASLVSQIPWSIKKFFPLLLDLEMSYSYDEIDIYNETEANLLKGDEILVKFKHFCNTSCWQED